MTWLAGLREGHARARAIPWRESEYNMRDDGESERAHPLPPLPYAPWPTAPSQAGPSVYPPSPEFYLSGAGRMAERNETPAYPAPPPEHDSRAHSYPAAAPNQWPAPDYASQRVGARPVIAQAQPDTPWRILRRYLIFIFSAAISVVAFWLFFNDWEIGVGIVALLFIHEMGHFVVIRAKGLPASLPVFIPLLGAYVTMRRMPRNVRDEAEIALAGPIAGGLAGLGCLALYQATGDHALLRLAYFSFFINLLNLVPVSPLDGGRIVGAISRWFWLVGLVGLGVGYYYTQNWILLLVAVFGFTQTLARFSGARGQDPYYKISIPARLYVTVLYFGLAGALVLGMLVTQARFL
jgi:Zn-dependent protease